MFLAMIREGQVVTSPSGKQWTVVDVKAGDVQVKDDEGYTMWYSPRALTHIYTPSEAAPFLEALDGAL